MSCTNLLNNNVANQLTGNNDIIITRKEVLDMKKKMKSGGYTAYSMMLNVLSPKVAIARACMIPGTRLLVWGLNACIIFGRLLILVFVVSLLMRKWWCTLGIAALDYIIIFKIQTIINYEIGSRLFVLDQYLELENTIE
jgi:hypothetical protein